MKLWSSCCLGPRPYHKAGLAQAASPRLVRQFLAGLTTYAARVTSLSCPTAQQIAPTQNRRSEKNREKVQDGSHSVYPSNVGSDIPYFLPYSGHRKVSEPSSHSRDGNYTSVWYQEVGIILGEVKTAFHILHWHSTANISVRSQFFLTGSQLSIVIIYLNIN